MFEVRGDSVINEWINCILKTIFICIQHPIFLRWFYSQKDEAGGMFYVQDEQDVDKAFWLESFQENTLQMWTNKVRTFDVKIWETSYEGVETTGVTGIRKSCNVFI